MFYTYPFSSFLFCFILIIASITVILADKLFSYKNRKAPFP